MTRIELSIATSYLPHWGAWEGIREIVQNGLDAEVEQNARLTVIHRPATKTLQIINEDAVLPYEALLMGVTTKADREDLIGQWGEGLKVGTLALLRAGHGVTIRSGSEVWTPSIARSEKFKADVLVIDIAKGRKDKPRVAIEIDGIDRETWEGLRGRFIGLAGLDADQVIKTTRGSLLLGEASKGRLYVKGIWVQDRTDLHYGYDLKSVTLDRDRRLIGDFDLHWETARIWSEAAASRPDLLSLFVVAISSDAQDVKGYESKFLGVPQALTDATAADFRAKHGADAVPVATLAESREIEHLGKRGILCTPSLQSILSRTMATAKTAADELKNEVVARYGWGELTEAERLAFDNAVALLVSVRSTFDVDSVDIVTYRSDDINGMYHKDTKRITIARRRLGRCEDFLSTLIHEHAHHVAGGDGEHSHVHAIQDTWRDIVVNLRSSLAGGVS